MTSILQYLGENGYVQGSDEPVDNELRDFVVEVIVRMINNPDIIINLNASSKSPFFVDLSGVKANNTPEKIKFNEVYKELLESSKFKELFIDMFGGTQTMLNVKFEIGQTQNNANGQTVISVNNPFNNVITINPVYLLNNNKMLIAKTIIHECIHAYLNVKLCNPQIGMSIPALNNMSFYNTVNQYYNGFNGGSQGQHNFIYNYMLPTMQTILSEVKDLLVTSTNNSDILNNVVVHIPFNNSPSTPFVWYDFYNNLSLLGLEDCQFFQDEIGTITIINGASIPINIVNQSLMQSFIQYIFCGQQYIQP